MNNLPRPMITRRLLTSVLVAVALAVTACGDDGDSVGDDGGVSAGPGEQQTDTGSTPSQEVEGDDPDDTEAVEASIEVLVPLVAASPAGFTTIDPSCASDDAPNGWFSYPVPEGWTQAGSGSGGSGSAFGSTTDVSLDTPEGRVVVTLHPDDRDLEDRLVNDEGEPTDSFDHETTIDGRTVTVTHAPAGTVTVGDQSVELMVADAAQAEGLEETIHRARIEVLRAPSIVTGGQSMSTESVVMEIAHPGPVGSIPAEVIETMVGGFSLPECTLERFTVMSEMTLNLDLNGDGRISDISEILDLPQE